jgi:hypothetical protein
MTNLNLTKGWKLFIIIIIIVIIVIILVALQPVYWALAIYRNTTNKITYDLLLVTVQISIGNIH